MSLAHVNILACHLNLSPKVNPASCWPVPRPVREAGVDLNFMHGVGVAEQRRHDDWVELSKKMCDVVP